MSKDLLSNFFMMVKEKGIMDDEIIEFIDKIFENKSHKVLEVISKGIVKVVHSPSNREVWLAKGNKCEHLIYPKTYCSCQDFYKNVVIKRKRPFCKHILAQVICEASGEYNMRESDDEDFKHLIMETDLNF